MSSATSHFFFKRCFVFFLCTLSMMYTSISCASPSWTSIGAYSGSDTPLSIQHAYRTPIDRLNKRDKIVRIDGIQNIQTVKQWDAMIGNGGHIPNFESSMPATHRPSPLGEQMVATVTAQSGHQYDLMVPVNMKLYAWHPGYNGDIYLPEEKCSDCRNRNALPIGQGHLKPMELVLDKIKQTTPHTKIAINSHTLPIH